CHAQLAEQGVDAVYIGYNNGMLPEHIPDLLSPLLKNNVPTFTQEGSAAVAGGVLMSVAHSDLLDEGRFSAAILAEIMNGKKPRSLSQRFESTLSLAVNLRTAAAIGWNIPLEILAAVDEFYQ
ncbi:MAG: ABC transporter substrate-binding protein, partial [Deltaproteobacteria bacterium]|nr:ABC transporter substrate-binding protein [Deltaproteobacteria bacterium]